MYQFDDHDYGPNDADGSAIARVAATQMFWSYVPHGDLHNYSPLFEEFNPFPEAPAITGNDSHFILEMRED